MSSTLVRVPQFEAELSQFPPRLISETDTSDDTPPAVLNLPYDMLLMIFELTCFGDHIDPHHSRTRFYLSHVCSEWRCAMLSTPKMWDVVSMGCASHVDMLSDFATRAGERPLSLTVLHGALTMNYTARIRIPQRITRRIRSLWLTRLAHFSMLQFESPDTDDAPLKELWLGPLALDYLGGGAIEYCFDARDPINSHFLLVESLTCNAVKLQAGRWVFPCLTRLAFHNLHSDSLIMTLRSIHAPALTHLELIDVETPLGFEQANHHIEGIISRLLHLRIVGAIVNVDAARYLVCAFQAPRLNTFELAVPIPGESQYEGIAGFCHSLLSLVSSLHQ